MNIDMGMNMDMDRTYEYEIFSYMNMKQTRRTQKIHAHSFGLPPFKGP